jgi:hypothetical protein
MPGQWLEEQLDGEHGKEGGRAPYLGLSTIAEAFGWAHAQEWGGERVVSNKETNSQQNTLQKKKPRTCDLWYVPRRQKQSTNHQKKKILRGCRLTPLFQLQKVPALWNTSFSCAYMPPTTTPSVRYSGTHLTTSDDARRRRHARACSVAACPKLHPARYYYHIDIGPREWDDRPAQRPISM